MLAESESVSGYRSSLWESDARLINFLVAYRSNGGWGSVFREIRCLHFGEMSSSSLIAWDIIIES